MKNVKDIEQHTVIEKIFKNNLKIEHSVKSIESLFENKRLSGRINYSPYYQRNYVWDKQKATYFIESILIGTEIPPLVFFNSGTSIEVIDGRQRYETIKKFIDLEFALVKSGLDLLNFLDKKNFNDLHPDVKEIFRNTNLRIIDFTVLNSESITENEEDIIKKEIFRRYNSGITPLQKTDLEQAIYIEDPISNFFKEYLKNNHTVYSKLIRLFLTKRDLEKIDDVYTLERLMSKIRQLLVITDIPIKRLSSKGRTLIEKYYEYFTENVAEVEELQRNFTETVKILDDVQKNFEKSQSELADNYLVYESLYWAIEVLRKENAFIYNDWNDNQIETLAKEIETNRNYFSMENPLFYKTVNDRYQFVSSLFKDKKDVDFKLYLETSAKIQEPTIEQEFQSNESYVEMINLKRINKPEPSNKTIEDIAKMIARNKFLIRPIYQRREVINRKKSSGLMESILMGIKIPPIFVFKRIDGVMEVVDGQQRLLSIIGFIGDEFMNEKGKMVKSDKNLFKLIGLNVLTQLNGEGFSSLSEDFKNKLFDFNLSIVTIDQKINPNFEPVDLFIRLNSKPYPIRENSFEMWNSYIDKDFIRKIRENVKKHSDWFYLRDPEHNYRMDNEQCYTILVYLYFMQLSQLEGEEFIKFYQRGATLNARVKAKTEITKCLESISTDKKVKINMLACIGEVENFINTLLKIVSIDSSIPSEQLRNEFSSMLNLKTGRRTMQSFYILWYVLNRASVSRLTKNTSYTKDKIKTLFTLTKDVEEDSLKNFNEEVEKFQKEFFE